MFDRWGRGPGRRPRPRRLLGAEPVITFGLAGPARPISASAPQTCQLDRSCDRVSIWRADWSAADSAQAPDLPVPGRIVDHLNVGDMTDEAAHGWTTDPPVLGVQPDSVLDRAVVAPGRLVADSGRHVVGGETFTLGGTVPGRPVTLTGGSAPGPRCRASGPGWSPSTWTAAPPGSGRCRTRSRGRRRRSRCPASS
ncbi:hypothetical protein [Pseudonocardia sp. ICBG601]|uniref:hypothetical protein n=1 Tax=Pseudonocardia sp. ICBG601 TaxID=2846759 RepID=UPI001CF71CC7|nr:hypothetical protein [Pseudonocardia sp. ICBG601]